MELRTSFNGELAEVLSKHVAKMRNNQALWDEYENDPTGALLSVVDAAGVELERREGFHAHVLLPGDNLPDEPVRGTSTRTIYYFKKDGEFQFKVVPGSAKGNDRVLRSGGSCCDCWFNCCVIEK